MRSRTRSIVWIAVAIAMALAITMAFLAFRQSSPIHLSAVSSYNSGGLVGGPTVTAPKKDLGAVDANRDIWLEISWQFFGEARTLNSVTVGGVAAKRLARKNEVPASANSEIWMVSAGAGDALGNATSADIVYSFDGGNPSITTQVYRVVGASETPAAKAVGSGSISITVPPGGVALVSLIHAGTASGSLSGVSEDFNALCGKDFLGIHASKNGAFSGPLTASFSEGTEPALAAVVLRPASMAK